jgi:hypothetical protein
MRWSVRSYLLLLFSSIIVYPLSYKTSVPYLFGNFAQIAGLVFAFAAYTRMVPTCAMKSGLRKAWSQCALGAFIWLVAQCLEIYCELVLNLIAYGTVADAFWVIGYVPLIAGFQGFVRHASARQTLPIPRKRLGFLLIAGALLYGLLFFFLIWPQLRQTEQRIAEAILDLTYPTLDFVLMIQCALLMIVSARVEYWRRFSVLSLIAFALTLVGDGILSLVQDFETFLYISIDLWYYSCYFFMAFAAEKAVNEKHPAAGGLPAV